MRWPVGRHAQARYQGNRLQRGITHPTQSIWNCNPKNVVQLTAQQQHQLNSL